MPSIKNKLARVWGAVIITASLALAGTAILPNSASAADVKPLLEGLSTSFTTTQTAATGTGGANLRFSSIVNQIITIVLFVVGVAAIIYLLISGFQYVTAGGDDEKAGNARKGIINAVIGIIIVLSAWFIFRAAVNVGTGFNGAAGGTFDSTNKL